MTSEQPWVSTAKLVAFDGDLYRPCDGDRDSSFSVQAINNGAVPWLRSPSWASQRVTIRAGTTLDVFTELVRSVGGDVWMRAGPTTIRVG